MGLEVDWLGCAGVVDCRAGTGSVELRRYAKDHPFAQLQGSDNIIAFTTQRYASQPLIVRYPTLPYSSAYVRLHQGRVPPCHWKP